MHFWTNCSGDWSQTWWIHSLWYSPHLMNFWSRSTELRPGPFSGLLLVEQYPRISWQTMLGIDFKLGGYIHYGTPQVWLSPHSTEGGIGVYWIHPDVCPSVCLQTRFLTLFEKTISSIHFTPGIYPYGVSLLSPIHFRVPSINFDPLVAKYFGKNGVSGTFWRNYQMAQFISNLTFTLMEWVSWPLLIFVFLALIVALLWSNIWPKMGSQELFTLQPLKGSGVLLSSEQAGRRSTPVSALTCVIFHGSFSNLARTLIALRSQTSYIMEVLLRQICASWTILMSWAFLAFLASFSK